MIKTSSVGSASYVDTTKDAGIVKEKIPPLDKSLVPEGINVSNDLWSKIYTVLSEAPRQMLKPSELNVHYSRRFKTSLGGNDLYLKCRVRNLTSLICAFPDVEAFRSGGDWYYRLRDRNSPQPRLPYRDKVSRMESKTKKHSEYSEWSTDDDEIDDGAEIYDLPPQPMELLPRGARLPNELRQRIFKLLDYKYRGGVQRDKFKEEFTRTYGHSIKNQRDCSLSEEELFHAMRDCIDSKKDKYDILWIKPRTADDIKRIHEDRPKEIFNAPALPLKESAKTRYYNQINPGRTGFIKVDFPSTSSDNFNRSSTEPYIAPKQPTQQPNVECAAVPSSSVNNPPLNRLINSSIRSNSARESGRNNAAQNKIRNIVKVDSASVVAKPTNSYEGAANAYVARPPKAESPLNEFNDIELLAEALRTLKNWINYEDLESFFESKYRRPLKLPKNLNLIKSLNRRPELFVLSDTVSDLSVRARRYVTGNFVDPTIFINPQTVIDFGLAPDDVYTGSLDCLQLEIGEENEVIISYVNEFGEFYVQMVSMEPAYRDLEYDMNQFYSDGDRSVAFEISADYIKVGFPLAFYLNPNWHRGETVDVQFYAGSTTDIFQIQVRDVDFGQTYWVPKSRVRFLKRDFVENRAPPCAIFVTLAYILPDPHKWRNNSRDVILEHVETASSMWIKVVSLISEDRTPEVYLVAHYGQEQPAVDVNEEMVKRSLAVYLNGAREQRENDNDLAAEDEEVSVAAERCFSSSGPHNFNRFMSIDANGADRLSASSSSASTTSDNVESFNKYGPEAMALWLVRSKSDARSSSSTTSSNATAQIPSSIASSSLYGTSSAMSPVENSFLVSLPDQSIQATSTIVFDNFNAPFNLPAQRRNYLQTPASIDLNFQATAIRTAPKTKSTPTKSAQNLPKPPTSITSIKSQSSTVKSSSTATSTPARTTSTTKANPVDKREEMMALLTILNGSLQSSAISEDQRLIYGSQVDEIMNKLNQLNIEQTPTTTVKSSAVGVSARLLNPNLPPTYSNAASRNTTNSSSIAKQNLNLSSSSPSSIARDLNQKAKRPANDASFSCSSSSTLPPTSLAEIEFDGVIDTSTAFRLSPQSETNLFASPIVPDAFSSNDVCVSPDDVPVSSEQDPYVTRTHDNYQQSYCMQHGLYPQQSVQNSTFYPAQQYFAPPTRVVMPSVNGYYQMPPQPHPQVVIREVHYVHQPLPAPYFPGVYGAAPYFYNGSQPPGFGGPPSSLRR